MKLRIYHILLPLCIALAAGCSIETEVLPGPGGAGFAVDFSVSTADENAVAARGIPVGENDIENMYVLLFDHNGTFLSGARAEKKSGGGPGNYRVALPKTDPGLPAARRKRIVHFVANYDWSGFSEAASVGKHEAEVVAPLSVGGGRETYWQRIELADGIKAGAFGGVIELVRNRAKISVSNGSSGLTAVTFAIGSYIDHGTVAAFNTSSGTFGEGVAVESPFGNVCQIAEADFVPAGSGDNWGTPIFCYERENSISSAPLYIILKGKYAGSQSFTYYKIDIFDTTAEKLYDIVRNCHYRVTVTGATGPGRATLLEAMNSPASNNLLHSIILEDYTSITDGTAVLNVETTVKTFVKAGAEYPLWFSYLPDGKNEDNTNVRVEIEQSSVESEKVLASATVVRTAGGAHVLLTTVGNLPPYNINSARLIISAELNGSMLRRVIKLRLRQPVVFGNFSISSNPAPATIGSPVNISFTVPNTIRSQLYPFPVYITSKNLTPYIKIDEQETIDDNLTLDYQIPGRYRYSYIVHGPGDHTVHFKTSAKGFSETMIVESELFETVEVLFSGAS